MGLQFIHLLLGHREPQLHLSPGQCDPQPPPGREQMCIRDRRYWVSVDSGLLVAAESEEDGVLVYRMSAYSPAQSPCPADGEFELPDGTVLHTLDES